MRSPNLYQYTAIGGFTHAKAIFLPTVELGVYFHALRRQVKKKRADALFFFLCVLGVRVALNGLRFAEKHRDAPYAGKAHERVDHAADRAHLTAAEERDEVKAEQADAAPVERADDGER